MEKNIYVYNFTANSGLMVKDIEYGIDPGIEDKIVVSFFYYSEVKEEKIEEKERKYKLYTTNKGSYFNYKGVRMYLNDFIRC